MNRQEFQALMDEQYGDIKEINSRKGHDYAGDDDALKNFKDAAKQLGVSPALIWAVYANKHWSAIMTFCREGKVESEGIEGRCHDAILDTFLLLGLIHEGSATIVEYPPELQPITDIGQGMLVIDINYIQGTAVEIGQQVIEAMNKAVAA